MTLLSSKINGLHCASPQLTRPVSRALVISKLCHPNLIGGIRPEIQGTFVFLESNFPFGKRTPTAIAEITLNITNHDCTPNVLRVINYHWTNSSIVTNKKYNGQTQYIETPGMKQRFMTSKIDG